MASIVEKVRRILDSKDLGDITTELCDFSLKEQNATAEAQEYSPHPHPILCPFLDRQSPILWPVC